MTIGGIAQESPTPAVEPERIVVIDNKALFSLHERLGSISPEERAAIVSERLQEFAENPLLSVDKLQLDTQDEVTNVVVNKRILLTITEADAQAVEQSREAYANEVIQETKSAINAYRERLGSAYFLKIGLYAGIASLCLLIALLGVRLIFPRLYTKIRNQKGKRIKTLKIQQFELLSADRIVELLVTLTSWMKQPIILVLLYFYFWFILTLLPWTKPLGQQLGTMLVVTLTQVGQGIWNYLPNLIFIIATFGIAYYVVKVVRLFFSAMEGGLIGFTGFYQDWSKPTFQIIRFLIFTFALALVIPYLPGTGSPALQGISLVLGLLVSLGSTAVVANIVAGLALTYTRAFKEGDRVQINDTTGDVLEKSFLVTRLKTVKNVVVTIPNSMVLATQIINFSVFEQGDGLILHTKIGLGYDVPWATVHELLIDAALQTHAIAQEPKPFVLQTKLNDFAVEYELNAYTRQPAIMAKIYSELHQNILNKFNEAQIEIMSPSFTALRDGQPSTVPAQYFQQGQT